MGSVKELKTTGDNDPELFPEEYYRHYMYCDNCGSFNITPWMASENHPEFTKRHNRIVNLMTVSIISLILSVVFGVFLHAFRYFATGAFVLDTDAIIWIVLSLISYLVFKSWGKYLDSKIQQLGVRCEACKKEYPNGSPFFTQLESNPKHYSMQDVPFPRSTTYWIRG